MPRRRRRRSRRSGSFQGWGYLLTAALAVALWQQSWSVSGWLALVLLTYMCWFHPTSCRLETLDGAPCTKPVIGWLRGCRHSHRGMKTSLPVLLRSSGHYAHRSCGRDLHLWRLLTVHQRHVQQHGERLPTNQRAMLQAHVS